jgi:hypothetical protein
MNNTRAWTASAVRSYYFDPRSCFWKPGIASRGVRLNQSGYYIAAHRDPDCCQAFGGMSQSLLGRFSRLTMRARSVKNMTMIN